MTKLTPEELRNRLRFDWTITQKMNGPLVLIRAYKSPADLGGRRHPVVEEWEAHRACAYLVEIRVRSLVGKGSFHDRFEVSFDLLAGGNYPYSDPACFVTSRPIPWSPHFLPSNGAICLGELWSQAKGRMTLGHLIVHIAKLLNFDEPDREPSYSGWNPAAVKYWRVVLKRQPITNGLVYPSLPAEVTHALEIPCKPLFRPAPAAGAAATRPHFRPRGR